MTAKPRTLYRLLMGLFALVAASASDARAQDSNPSALSSEWSFAVAPYIWAAGLEGDVATFPPAPPAQVDASFSDIWENLDLAFMATAEARKGRFALLADLVYVRISADAATPGPFFGRAELDTTSFTGTFEGSYRAVATERGNLDLLVGARVWSVSTDLSLNAGLLPARRRDESETWVDPVVGIRGRLELDSRFYVTFVANVGGFGAGSDSTWDVFGGLGYRVSDWFAPVIGYRHLAVDYEKGDFLYDVDMSGPLIGGVIRF